MTSESSFRGPTWLRSIRGPCLPPPSTAGFGRSLQTSTAVSVMRPAMRMNSLRVLAAAGVSAAWVRSGPTEGRHVLAARVCVSLGPEAQPYDRRFVYLVVRVTQRTPTGAEEQPLRAAFAGHVLTDAYARLLRALFE